MYRALEIPGHINLSALSYFLYRRGLSHKITEESGRQVLWTASEEHAGLVEQIYSDWQSGALQLEEAPARRGVLDQGVGNLLRRLPWKRFPVTMLLLVICLAVGLFTQMGDNINTVSHFTFVKFRVMGEYAYFSSLAQTLDAGDYWRLITPIFLHFGILHFAFNMLWLFDIGRRIEFRQDGLHLLGLVLVSGLLSNFAQYYFGGASSLFGGFSGVVYGMLGYCLVREKIDPDCQFGIQPAIYGFMMIWLAIGFTGILGTIGFGNMANAAHTGGLVSGVVLGAIAGLLFRQKPAS
ncbi:MAG: rhomboid family intramembrane serine protease [Endozoicomonas sp.]